jgi:hypothetical protein
MDEYNGSSQLTKVFPRIDLWRIMVTEAGAGGPATGAGKLAGDIPPGGGVAELGWVG